jgi:NitT/TauT family transport system permease protein
MWILGGEMGRSLNGRELVIARVFFIGALLFIWELLGGKYILSSPVLNPIFFSSPIRAVIALFEEWDIFLVDLGITIWESLVGLFAGIFTGVIAAILFTRYENLGKVVDPLITATNSLPRPAIAPLMLIWFGLGFESKYIVSWSVVFFIIYYNVCAGIRAVDPDYILSLKVIGADTRHIVTKIYIPAILAWLFSALRVCVIYSFFGAIVAEFAGSMKGIGYRLVIAQGLLLTDSLFALLFLLMLTGLAMIELTKRFEARALKWQRVVKVF